MDIATQTLTAMRAATLEDLPAIREIEVESFDDPYTYLVLRQLFEVHGATWLVAEGEGAVVGYALTLEKDGVAWLMSIAVKPGHHGHHYGRGLLSAALAMCRERGWESVLLTVCPDNVSAYTLFKQAGFAFVEHDERYFGTGGPRDILVYKPTP